MKQILTVAVVWLALAGCQPSALDSIAENDGGASEPHPTMLPPAPPVPPVAPKLTPAGTADVLPAASDPAAIGSNGGPLPMQLFNDTQDRIDEVLATVVDAPSALAAAPRLKDLARELRPRIRPAYLWLAQATPDQKNAFVLQRAQSAAGRKAGQRGMDFDNMIELARQPGNEPFREALIDFFRAIADESPRIPAARALEMLDQLR